jgi:hypothetical protein
MIEGKWPIADQAARIARNRAFVDEVNARTVCAHCGAQPIEWHNPDHVRQGKQHRRIARLAGKTYSIAAIEAEIARCTPLCRRCHMAEDGRLAGFTAQAGRPKTKKPPTPCRECQQPASPLRRERCKRCYERLRNSTLTADKRQRITDARRLRYYAQTANGENVGAVKAREYRQRGGH